MKPQTSTPKLTPDAAFRNFVLNADKYVETHVKDELSKGISNIYQIFESFKTEFNKSDKLKDIY